MVVCICITCIAWPLAGIVLVKCAEVSARKSTGKDYSLISNIERLL